MAPPKARPPGSALHDERFSQLSQDMSTLRWSWTDYLLIDEVLDVRYDTAKPCVFAIHYAHIYSQQVAPPCRPLPRHGTPSPSVDPIGTHALSPLPHRARVWRRRPT